MDDADLPRTIPEMLAEAVRRAPQRDAVAMVARTLSYADLDRETARMAQALLATGAGKGVRIALMAPDGIDWLVAFLGALRIGALVTAVSTLCRPAELAYILKNCDAQILFGARRILDRDVAPLLTEALPGLEDEPGGRLRLTCAPFLRSIYLDDAEGLGWAEPVESLLSKARAHDARDQELLRAAEREVVAADPAAIIYTSGSTAAPKAVVHRQYTLVRKSLALADYFGIRPEDRMLPTLPIFWVGGMSMALMVLAKGGALVYAAAPDVKTILSTLVALDVTRVNSWGPRHRKLVQAAIAQGLDIERIGGLAPPRDVSGELIPPERFPNLLGMSESFSAHSGEPMDHALPADQAGASGRAIGEVERRVVDLETGVVLGPDQVGELQIRGPMVMEGFYKLEPWKVFQPDGFYATGDLVRIDGEGRLFFVARSGDFIKTSGANVSRLEVEQALTALPGVAMAVVVGTPDPEVGEQVVAAVAPDGGEALEEATLRDQLREVLSAYKVPRRIVPIRQDDIEWTATGIKIDLPKMRDKITRLIAASPTVDHHVRPEVMEGAACS